MDILLTFHDNLLRRTPDKFRRFLYDTIHWDQRMLAVKGPRGAGKTTLMLQHLKNSSEKSPDKFLYLTADHYWFYTHNLFETADIFYKNAGRHLYIDEVHKYPHWSRELKNIYDGFPDMQVVFSSSSALDIYRGESDLSRRVVTYELPGMSFREYLWFTGYGQYQKLKLNDILNNHYQATRMVTQKLHPLPLFRQYLKTGYLPIIEEIQEKEVPVRIAQTINTVLETDLAYIENYVPGTAYKVKNLLGVIAESAPFKPNIAALARKLDVSRDSVYAWFSHLEKARLINLLHAAGKGTSFLQKPEKVYLENPNLAFALKSIPDTGSVRETFLLNQLLNSKHHVKMPKQGDFLIDDDILFEVGGTSKRSKQIKGIDNSYLIKDDIEHGFATTIPLWLFGFLY